MARLCVLNLRQCLYLLVPIALVFWVAEFRTLLPLQQAIRYESRSVRIIQTLPPPDRVNDGTRAVDDAVIVLDDKSEEPTPEWYKMIRFVNANNKECAGKERLLEILLLAGVEQLTLKDCRDLPYWTEVTSLYGDEPIVYGLESCATYRETLQWDGFSLDPDPKVAGLFDVGTNAFADLLQLNLRHPLGGKRELNMPGGKHTPLLSKKWFWNYTSHQPTSIFPLVLIRDPFRWMNSMCKAPYAANWKRGLDNHCPNLVPSIDERHDPTYDHITTFQVSVDRTFGAPEREFDESYESLADMWSKWYRQWHQQTKVPRLILRYEDTLFHLEAVMKIVSKCLGLPLEDKFRYQLDASKAHGDSANFKEALIKYGSESGRYGNMTLDDREYARGALDGVLMDAFRYPQAPDWRRQQINDNVRDLVTSSSTCLGKRKLLEVLFRTGQESITVDDCQVLPSDFEVAKLYGDEAVIVGLESCQDYREQYTRQGIEPRPLLGGLLDESTESLVRRLGLPFEKLDELAPLEAAFPIYLVQDPLPWMKHVCENPDDPSWKVSASNDCQNVAQSSRRATYRNDTDSTMLLREDDNTKYKSLVETWSAMYREYLNFKSPRLIVRVEDILLRADSVTQEISKCLGLPLHHAVFNRKSTIHSSDVPDIKSALVKYGKEESRYDGLSVEDFDTANKALGSDLLRAFHYKVVPVISIDNTVRDALVSVMKRNDKCHGKEELLETLVRAGMDNLNETHCDTLPFWNDVKSLYGDEPVIFGLDTCSEYRQYLQDQGLRPKPRVGGLFNTGTNAFVDSLTLNFEELSNRLEYNLFRGKHSSIATKEKLKPGWLTPDVLPIILVRDPFRWMSSMCKLPYHAKWQGGLDGHCPNLVPSDDERSLREFQNLTTFGVEVGMDRYASLADMWSRWNRDYFEANFPRLIIRFEDTLFHPEKLMSSVLECIGAPVKQFQYHLENAKTTDKSSDFVSALAKYGRQEGRYDGMTSQDREYAQEALDRQLMHTFRYSSGPGGESSTADNQITRLVSQYVTCHGKEHLLRILQRAGKEVTLKDCQMLPPWEEITDLYGEKPVVLGLETCGQFRSNLARLHETGGVLFPFVRVAGLFNTGTNALAQSFVLNLKNASSIKEFENPAGKHVPAKLIWRSIFENDMKNRSKVLQVVLVRDPMRWMQSMCKIGYNAKWKRGLNGRCPNLVPTATERRIWQNQNLSETFEVTVSLKNMQYFDYYKSLADMWSDWNRIFYDLDYPRLIVRFEDTLFHAEEVMHRIAECTGIKMELPFQYVTENAKTAKSSADFATALAKYGRKYGRLDGLFPLDKVYLQRALDPTLMRKLRYLNVDESTPKVVNGLVRADNIRFS